MTYHAIHWHEGQLIRPQHFQSAERSLRESVRIAEEWAISYAYGLRTTELDQEALTNWEFRLRRCQARLRDGSHICYPEDALLDPHPIPKTAFPSPSSRLMIHLAVPRLELGRRNAHFAQGGDQETASPARYRVEEFDIEDENTPGYPFRVPLRRPVSKLLLGEKHLASYETIPIARLRLGTTAEAAPVIDTDYIPPLLSCDAWPPLQDGILKAIYDYLAGQADEIARIAKDRGVSLESGHPQDPGLLQKLDALNTGTGYLFNLWRVRGIHPLTAYMELCRIVGRLAVFRDDWNMKFPDVPAYDHDDLGRCFGRIRELLLGRDPIATTAPKYEKRIFEGDGLQMRVRMDNKWLAPDWDFYIGVESKLTFQEVEQLLLGRLSMKVGASDRVDTLYTRGMPGVYLRPEASAHRILPRGDWTYWRVDRESEEWNSVEQTLWLAIRFNERQVKDAQRVGLTGQQSVQVVHQDGNLVSLVFALYAVPHS
jgi:type VI secretion system protein ImpJ